MAPISLKKERMYKYFIDSAFDIIQRDGIDSITIRKVATETGYNSATIYNYFENLDHLIFMASMKFVKEYSVYLLTCLKETKDPLERVYIVWDIFCNYSFAHPDIYRAIFFPYFERDKHLCFEDFYSLYPEDMVSTNDPTLQSMFIQYNIYDRGMTLLDECVEHGYFKSEDLPQVSDRIYIIYEALLFRLLRGKINKDDAKTNFDTYFNHLIISFRQDLSSSEKDEKIKISQPL